MTWYGLENVCGFKLLFSAKCYFRNNCHDYKEISHNHPYHLLKRRRNEMVAEMARTMGFLSDLYLLSKTYLTSVIKKTFLFYLVYYYAQRTCVSSKFLHVTYTSVNTDHQFIGFSFYKTSQCYLDFLLSTQGWVES